MKRRRLTDWRVARALGIGVLAVSVVHVPLPQADYHNIRHHDAPGEMCVYHDHLLRWHPSAEINDDVTMLHWHWFVPIVEFGDHHVSADDEHHLPGQGPSVHAQLGDWPAPDWQGEPVVRPDSHGRLVDHLTLGQTDASLTYMSDEAAPLDPQSGRFSPHADDPPGILRALRAALYQRWNC